MMAFMLLAMGTAAVAAGMGHTCLMLAACAFQHHDAAVLIPAAPEGLESLIMAWQELMAVPFFQIAAVAIDQISEEDHQRSSQRRAKPATRSSMRSVACCRFTSVRWA